MNKNLISQNPVQRFKLGKIIKKFQSGGQQPWAGYYTVGNWPRSTKKISTNSNKQSKVSSQAEYIKKVKSGQINPQESLTFIPPTLPNIIKEKETVNVPLKPGVKAEETVQKNSNVSNSSNANKPTPTSKVIRPVVRKTDWGTEYQKALDNLTQTQKDYLTSLGADLSDVKSLQRVIGTKDDGMFGNNSNSALIAKLAEMPKDFGIKPATPELSGMNKVVVDWVNNNKNLFNTPTPYRTSNTYENADFSDRLKAMGIKSNADLIDFGWRTNGENYDWKGDNWAKQFRSDINQALGGDWSDQNIRKVFNTQGKWRGSRVGDFSDIQGVLQNNAGKWNGVYDNTKQAALQKAQTTVNTQSPVKKWINYFPTQKDNYTNYLLKQFGFLKNGGLISKNPVIRFKKGGFANFRIAVQ